MVRLFSELIPHYNTRGIEDRRTINHGLSRLHIILHGEGKITFMYNAAIDAGVDGVGGKKKAK